MAKPYTITTASMILLLAVAACSGDSNTTTDATTGGSTTGDGPGDTTTAASQNPTTDDTPTTSQPGDTTTDDGPTAVTTATTTDTSPDTDATGHHDTEAVDTTTGPAPETCEDGLQNQDESDVDCGGATCDPCADGLACAADTDCQIASCIVGVCAAPGCSDGVKNQDETDADCGGASCDACMDNLVCAEASDCQSGVCTDGLCTPAACGDGVKNGDESDVDCGGAVCDACLGELACNSDDDCLSEKCTAGICDAVECLVDSDCDALDTDCSSGSCKKPGFTCVAVPLNEGKSCQGPDLCLLQTTCTAGVCGGGTPKDCLAQSDQCNVGSCNPQTGTCGKTPLPDGTKCEDGNACTALETCKTGSCGSLAPLLTEPFANNNAGWTLGTEWEIGPALASVGCQNGQDPGTDHTPTADNGVAAVGLGKCVMTAQHDYYCLTSPVVDLSTANAEVYLSYWRWLNSDYTPFMKNKIEVWNGNAWVVVFETFGSGTYDAAWTFFSYNVTPHKNDKFQARWCYNIAAGGVYNTGGWNVDDVTLGPAACVQ